MILLEFSTETFGKPFQAQKMIPDSTILNSHPKTISEGALHQLLPPRGQALTTVGKVYSFAVGFHQVSK